MEEFGSGCFCWLRSFIVFCNLRFSRLAKNQNCDFYRQEMLITGIRAKSIGLVSDINPGVDTTENCDP